MDLLTYKGQRIDRAWFDNDMGGLSDRIRRCILADEDYRLPFLHRSVPVSMVPAHGKTVVLYRGVPKDVEEPVIRPGDWVSLSRAYALQHGHAMERTVRVLSLNVPAEDVIWAGTDMNEFFYAPRSLARKDGEGMMDALSRIGMAAFTGEGSAPECEERRIPSAVIALARSRYKLAWDGIHGAAHWSRVKLFGETIGRACGADLEVVRHFAFLHDISRENDNGDIMHGARAAEVIYAHRDRFNLDRQQLSLLMEAVEHHSGGETTQNPTIGACWDADRLDLARLLVEPSPALLSTAPARDPEIIEWARKKAQIGLTIRRHRFF